MTIRLGFPGSVLFLSPLFAIWVGFFKSSQMSKFFLCSTGGSRGMAIRGIREHRCRCQQLQRQMQTHAGLPGSLNHLPLLPPLEHSKMQDIWSGQEEQGLQLREASAGGVGCLPLLQGRGAVGQWGTLWPGWQHRSLCSEGLSGQDPVPRGGGSREGGDGLQPGAHRALQPYPRARVPQTSPPLPSNPRWDQTCSSAACMNWSHCMRWE